MEADKYILLTIDVEDWFQVENFKPWIPFETWDQRELRVEKNTHRLLDLFDETEVRGQKAEDRRQKSEDREHTFTNAECGMRNAESGHSKENTPTKEYEPSTINYEVKPNGQLTTDNGQTKKMRATFFVLGWIAERLPDLVREIQSRGHEIASHGVNHKLPNQQSAAELKKDLTDSKKRLENLIGSPVFGYRAPSFAIDDDILKLIEDVGYFYDSSYNSFGLHGRYGQISLNGTGKKGVAHKLSTNFCELPISNLKLFNKVLPLGGGGYFRLTPYRLFRRGVQQILKKDEAYVFYMHPWEIDPGQPRIREASAKFKFRHYSNLSKTEGRLKRLIKDSKNHAFTTCKEYLGVASNNK